MKIKEMSQEILFEVFCDRYNEAYVGDTYSTEDLDFVTVKQVNKSLSCIKIQYKDSRTNKTTTTTPDTVFKKMVEYVPILPNNANKWNFCLPCIYYNSLTEQIKQEMTAETQNHKFSLELEY